MRLLEVGIQNFKSLKSVTLKPGSLSVFIGPNGAGKSNLADSIDFIGETYRSALNVAMVTHGGFERLVYAGPSKSSPSMGFSVTALLSKDDLRQTWLGQANDAAPYEVTVRHRVTISRGSNPIDDPFHISEESMSYVGRLSETERVQRLLEIRKDKRGSHIWPSRYAKENFSSSRNLPENSVLEIVQSAVDSSTSMLVPFTVESLILPSIPLRSSLGAISLYELDPNELRRDGVPMASPVMGRHGMHFPAVLAWLKLHYPRAFQEVLGVLTTVLPTLEDIDIVDRERGRLTIEFRETGLRQAWTARDMSDGTLRTLGMLTALFEPGSKVTIVEEPENSLHPWAIGQFIEACRLAALTKQVVLTTHSPEVIDQLTPDEIWVVSKPGTATKVDRLVDLDPDAKIGWEEGEFTLSQYLRSGIVREAVPVSPL